jgi:hypothetical protein
LDERIAGTGLEIEGRVDGFEKNWSKKKNQTAGKLVDEVAARFDDATWAAMNISPVAGLRFYNRGDANQLLTTTGGWSQLLDGHGDWMEDRNQVPKYLRPLVI